MLSIPIVDGIQVECRPDLLPYTSTDPEKPGEVHVIRILHGTEHLLVSQVVFDELAKLPELVKP